MLIYVCQAHLSNFTLPWPVAHSGINSALSNLVVVVVVIVVVVIVVVVVKAIKIIHLDSLR